MDTASLFRLLGLAAIWGGSFLFMRMGAPVLIPLLPLFPAQAEPTSEVMAAVVALGVVCSGMAYLLYFRLVADVGAPSALTVTFLIPVFGVLWGHLLLDEVVGWHTLVGSLVVIVGTALVTGFSPRQLLRRRVVTYV